MGRWSFTLNACLCGFPVAIIAGCATPSLGIALSGGVDSTRAKPASSSYGDLIYLSGNPTTFYAYPGVQEVGTLDIGARALCGDASGDVFVVDGPIYEFAHGGTQVIKSFGKDSSNFSDCTVDPTTGNVAGTFGGSPSYSGITVFTSGAGSTSYAYPNAIPRHCAYDGSGNLFAIAQIEDGPNVLLELPAGGSELEDLTELSTGKAGAMRWDGSYLTYAAGKVIYRLSISGSTVTQVGQTRLKGSGTMFQYSIYEGNVAVPYGPNTKKTLDNIGFWHYPKSGNPWKRFAAPGYENGRTDAVLISPGSSR